MLSSVSSSVASLTQLPLAPEEGAAAAPRGRARSRAPTDAPRALATGALAAGAAAGKRAGKARASRAGYATGSGATPTRARGASTARRSGPLAFLDDPRLSVEEKLLKLLSHLNDKWNKDLDRKMKEFKQPSGASSSGGAGKAGGSGSSSGLGGLLKKAVGFASVVMPQLGVSLAALKDPALRGVLKGVAGPALAAAATAAGQPELAPLALKFGPDLVDGAASLAAAATDGGGAAAASGGDAGTSSGATAREAAGGIGSDRNDQLKLMEMQRILDQQKEMFSLVSNLLRTTHDTRMAVIQNVR